MTTAAGGFAPPPNAGAFDSPAGYLDKREIPEGFFLS